MLLSACMRKFVVLFFVLGFVLSMAACSSNSERKAVYESSKEHAKTLEMPPDLDEPATNSSLEIPAIAKTGSTFSSYSGTQQQTTGQVQTSTTTSARLIRDGNMHWLEIEASAEELWAQLLAFFQNQGFEIKVSDAKLGFIETDWQENREDVPQGWFSSLIGKIYSSGLQDKYRVRVEKAGKTTRIFIAHRGLEEKGSGETLGDIVETWWEARDSDPELEAEMMQRFLVFRGLEEVEAKQVVQRSAVRERAVLKEESDSLYLQVNENFPRSWRRTGLALDRLGLQVEDRNRSTGMYYIKLTEDFLKAQGKEKGWFESLFSAKDKSAVGSYIIKMVDQGESTRVSLQDKEGKTITNQVGKQLLTQLQRYLR